MPAPTQMADEPKKKWASRLVRFYIHEGFPQKQAVAIAMRKAGMPKPKSKRKKRPTLRPERKRPSR